jgi:hypothetical protein
LNLEMRNLFDSVTNGDRSSPDRSLVQVDEGRSPLHHSSTQAGRCQVIGRDR